MALTLPIEMLSKLNISFRVALPSGKVTLDLRSLQGTDANLTPRSGSPLSQSGIELSLQTVAAMDGVSLLLSASGLREESKLENGARQCEETNIHCPFETTPFVVDTDLLSWNSSDVSWPDSSLKLFTLEDRFPVSSAAGVWDWLSTGNDTSDGTVLNVANNPRHWELFEANNGIDLLSGSPARGGPSNDGILNLFSNVEHARRVLRLGFG
ncbi:hypothetical protein MIND_00925100 [Mycena indigotica]|uniref:Uncharacterized protein n=1 Tax=Mycena indigotica TaxID=2126181 RepID=A0A8H6SDG6_9AGAR|nr:uncharacterized protein MIND_00925100 [Mycena indigotica]KAF7296933.1 hypothetical protein MIND_00925100 [Mycena indigotica]